MSFKPYTEKIKKKKIGICSILGRIRIRIQNRTRIHHPGSGSADPDPHQNDTDPKHCFAHLSGAKRTFIRSSFVHSGHTSAISTILFTAFLLNDAFIYHIMYPM